MTTLHLRYAVEGLDRRVPFTEEMEAASILCLALSKRKTSLLTGKPWEDLVFLTKTGYPLWLVPWENKSILVDGLNYHMNVVEGWVVPDISAFTEALLEAIHSQSQLLEVLRKYVDTFKGRVSSEVLSVGAILVDDRLHLDILQYLQQGTALEKSQALQTTVIPLRMDETRANNEAEQLVQVWKDAQAKIKGLQYANSVLNHTVEFQVEKIQKGLNLYKEESEKTLEKMKTRVDKEGRRLAAEKDRKLVINRKSMNQEIKDESLLLSSADKKLQTLRTKKESTVKKLEYAKRRNHKVQVLEWSRRLRQLEKDIDRTQREAQKARGRIGKVTEQWDDTSNMIRATCDRRINEEVKKLADLQNHIENVTKARRRTIEELQSASANLGKAIQELTQKGLLYLSALNNTAIPWRLEETTLVVLPFYLAGLRGGERIRYIVFPPVEAAGNEGLVMRVQKALKGIMGSRLNILLRSRFTFVDEMMSAMFETGLHKKKDIESDVLNHAFLTNILRKEDLRNMILKGLEELEKEGWLVSDELQTVLNACT